MRITDRDLEILKLVESYRFVSGEQIERCVFLRGEKGERRRTRCAARLRKMFDNGLLGRVRWPFHAITLPMVYYLEKPGADLLALRLGVERDRIRAPSRTEKRPAIDRGLLFLVHTLTVNDFRHIFTQACEREGVELRRWLNEYELGRDYAEIEYRGRTTKQAVQPDGYCLIGVGDKQAHLFVEVDMDTSSATRWAPKVLALSEYRRTGNYADRFGTRSLRVLCVSPSESRTRLLINWTKQVIPDDCQALFWFAVRDEISIESVLKEPIWEVAGEGRRMSLLNA
jgi:hypothetical protein